MNLIKQIQDLQNSEIKTQINEKIKQFQIMQTLSSEEIFLELCFCLLTANFNAQRAIEIQNQIQSQFLTLNEKQLAKKLKQLGHRFPNKRAEFIAHNQKYSQSLKEQLISQENDQERREWLVKNIKGLGMKESSHFLRNIGFLNLAILDFHIIDVLIKNKLITQPKSKTLSKKLYLEIENKLEKLANKLNLSQGELDFYLWYLETQKILK